MNKREPTFNIKNHEKFKDKIRIHPFGSEEPKDLYKINKEDKNINEKIIINGNLREFYQRNAITVWY